ncbi:MAG: asparagine--tRNA ligase [Deltaproteobacteria bacterium]|nr:asparagine--tRNA ligase [Deltaproteobacteria bacterium]
MSARPMRISELFQKKPVGTTVRTHGWIRTRRDSKGGFSFLEVNDGSCLKNIQVLVDGNLENYTSELLKLSPGCSVEVTGALIESPGKGQAVEIQASGVRVLGWADPDEYPLQKKRHSFEFLRTLAHLRPRTNTFGAISRIRNTMADAVHRFFQDNGFVYLHAPIITGSDCEGAGEMFHVTALDLDSMCRGGSVTFSEDFFRKPAHLTVSGQLEAEAYAMALGRVYTFGPTFRAEDSNTSRHLAEFWMVEPEMAFCDLDEDIDLVEAFLKFVIGNVLERCPEDMDLFHRFVDTTISRVLEDLLTQRFERISYTEAVNLVSRSKKTFDVPIQWGDDLQSEHERFLTEDVFKRPVVLTGYPKAIRPFYMRVNDDGNTVAAMDVLVPRVGEIVGGSQREERYEVLAARMKEAGMNLDDYWWYLDLRKYGTAPHSGFGLGFDRLVQFVTGMSNIRDVIPFPRTPGNLEF